MSKMITKEEYADCINGFRVVDCAIRKKDWFFFSVRHGADSDRFGPFSEWKVRKREVGFYLDEELGGRLGYTNLSSFETTYAGASAEPIGQIVFVDSKGQVYARGRDTDGVENPIPASKLGPRRGAIRRIRMIGGVLYVVGTAHTVCRRRGPNDWESLFLNLPQGTAAEHNDDKKSEDMAFEDIDAFSPDDIYVVGGRGVVWHCNGKSWQRIPFPSNMYLHSVCCAGDGQVYIGAQSGTVFRGRGNTWKMITRGDLSLPFKDIVWHADRPWCTSDYGLWTLDGDSVVRADLPSEIGICAGNLSAADGVLLMAGTNGAAYHDGKEWKLIFNAYAMETALGKAK